MKPIGKITNNFLEASCKADFEIQEVVRASKTGNQSPNTKKSTVLKGLRLETGLSLAEEKISQTERSPTPLFKGSSKKRPEKGAILAAGSDISSTEI